ncbi:MAG: hypothetical protein Fur0046_04000 [Cyanobacteria bacterium J069]|nr:MAG: hypothetical protein D6742_16615 [Cyanobacteria bacterium J069]
MKPDVRSTNLGQRVLFLCSVIISTVLAGAQAAVATPEAIAKSSLSSLAEETRIAPLRLTDMQLTDTGLTDSARSIATGNFDRFPSSAQLANAALAEPEFIEPEFIEPEFIEPEPSVNSAFEADSPAAVPSAETAPAAASPELETELEAELEAEPLEPVSSDPAAPTNVPTLNSVDTDVETGTAADLDPAVLEVPLTPSNPAIAESDPANPSLLSPAPLNIAQTGPLETRYIFSYIGAGINIGIAGDAALGDTSFAVLSKVALNSYLSLRPSLLIEDDVTFLVPVTYDFAIAGPGEGSGIAPFAGLGLAFSTGDDNAVDFLITGGVDFPINESLVATASANLAPFGDEVDFGMLLGLGYTFASRRAVVRRPTIADVEGAVGGTADALGRTSQVNPSFLGVGVNLGIGGDSALGNTSFAVLSKIALSRTLSIRPALLIEDEVEVLLPFTFDLEPIRTSYATLAPYLGAGVAFSFGDDSDFDLLLTGGIDIPLTSSLALTTGINFGVFDSFDIGATLGLVYTFSPY